MESDSEDFVYYGTPIEREDDLTSRKKIAVAGASGSLRSLPAWKQEVTDEEGRRRFHGAFTGGYSAGYYNTVGSKEGWTPQTFTSSRKNRAEFKQQDISNFLDDDEKAEIEGRALGTSMQFDTFGSTAAELARKQAEKEQQQRPSIIPGPAPDEIVLPVTDSIGVKLLLKMGWRHGHAIKDSRSNSLYDARREARKAFLALSSDDAAASIDGSKPVKGDLENVMQQPEGDGKVPRSIPVFVLNPKQDLHGLGFDPFKHAPEFREKKRSRLAGDKELGLRKPLSMRESLFGVKSGKVAPGFGIGALEELDTEDEDVYTSGYDFEETYVQEDEEPIVLSIENKKKWSGKEEGVLPGFRPALSSENQLERFDPPVIPKGFVPQHKFPSPLDRDNKFSGPPPVEISPPEDKNLKIMIDGVATMVARCGKIFEDLSREKNQSNPLFSFLYGGKGHEYYARKLWEEKQKCKDGKTEQLAGREFLKAQKMTAESRGKILGEKPLDKTTNDQSSISNSSDVQLQYNLVDTFITPATFSEGPDAVKPFKDDPVKQERFEQFLKEKYRGGLRSKDAGGASKMSETARARERLEFEAAAEAIAKGKRIKLPNQQPMEIMVTTSLQFTSGGSEKVVQGEDLLKKAYPKREEFQWRPSPILCKRFDIMDPYMGKPPPPPRPRSKMDSLLFLPDSVKPAKVEETFKGRTSLPGISLDGKETVEEEADEQIEINVEVENVERPVDLYKAIFSDDSDEDEERSTQQVDDPNKKIEVANTTLNRLIAGDFLESLGKELGLEVPPDLPPAENKNITLTSQKESITPNKEDINTVLVENKPQTTTPIDFRTSPLLQGDNSKNYRPITGVVSSETKPDKVDLGKVGKVDKNARSSLDRHKDQSSSSSGDERRRKRSRHRRHKSSSLDDDTGYSSDDYRERHHSRSKDRRKGSSREKSSSRKQSRHHKRRRGDSPIRSSRRTERDRDEKREKRK